MTQTISMTINGGIIGPIDVPDDLMMISFLHEYVGLTGTKFGCGAGVCHACTIIEDRSDGTAEILRTCINGVERFNGKTLRTVEGHAVLNADGEIESLHPVQNAFIKNFSFQCGWCTSGFVNAATALYEKLLKSPIAKKDVRTAIENALGEHVCRCTGYVKYYDAMEQLILETEGLTIS